MFNLPCAHLVRGNSRQVVSFSELHFFFYPNLDFCLAGKDFEVDVTVMTPDAVNITIVTDHKVAPTGENNWKLLQMIFPPSHQFFSKRIIFSPFYPSARGNSFLQ